MKRMCRRRSKCRAYIRKYSRRRLWGRKLGKSSGQGKSLKQDISLEVLVMTERYTLTLPPSMESCVKPVVPFAGVRGRAFSPQSI